jgi:hypothetical protein
MSVKCPHLSVVCTGIGDNLQAPEEPRGATSDEALFNCLNILLGCGVLSIPFALEEGGWAALGILALMGLATNYTGKVLIKCQEYFQRHPDETPPSGSTIRMDAGLLQTCAFC